MIKLICLRSLLLEERIKGLTRGHTKIKSWSMVVNGAQNSIIFFIHSKKMVKLLPQHAEIEKNRERLVVKIQQC